MASEKLILYLAFICGVFASLQNTAPEVKEAAGLSGPSAPFPTPQFVRFLGSNGSAPGLFKDPCALALAPSSCSNNDDNNRNHNDDNNNRNDAFLLVADAGNNRIQSFAAQDGSFIATWGAPSGSADGQLTSARGVFVHPNYPQTPEVFVADTGNQRIQVFSVRRQGRDVQFLRKWGPSNSNPQGQLIAPFGIAVHPTSLHVYVVDYVANRVVIFDQTGGFIGSFGSHGSANGQFDNPFGVALHPTRDLLLISDHHNHRIQAFTLNGTFLYTWGSQGSGDGQFISPGDVVMHPTKKLVFVSDAGNARVQVFDLKGKFVAKFGSQGTGELQFSSPLGITLMPEEESDREDRRKKMKLFVGEYYNNRVQCVQL